MKHELKYTWDGENIESTDPIINRIFPTTYFYEDTEEKSYFTIYGHSGDDSIDDPLDHILKEAEYALALHRILKDLNQYFDFSGGEGDCDDGQVQYTIEITLKVPIKEFLKVTWTTHQD